MSDKNVNLKEIPTCQLVEELTSREGVESITVEPYKNETLKLEGPAVILIVVD